MIEIRFQSAASPQATELIAALDRDIIARYPGLPTFGIDVETFERDGGVFAVGYDDGAAVACGALRPYGDEVELKRMYVRPDRRGRGFARTMLAFLEAEAARRGFSVLLLETGKGQPEAIALYESSGYRPRAPFGAYLESTISRFYEKSLRGNIGVPGIGNPTA